MLSMFLSGSLHTHGNQRSKGLLIAAFGGAPVPKAPMISGASLRDAN